MMPENWLAEAVQKDSIRRDKRQLRHRRIGALVGCLLLVGGFMVAHTVKPTQNLALVSTSFGEAGSATIKPMASTTPFPTVSLAPMPSMEPVAVQLFNVPSYASTDSPRPLPALGSTTPKYGSTPAYTPAECQFISQIRVLDQQILATQNQIINLHTTIQAQSGGYGITADQMARAYDSAYAQLSSQLSSFQNQRSSYSNQPGCY